MMQPIVWQYRNATVTVTVLTGMPPSRNTDIMDAYQPSAAFTPHQLFTGTPRRTGRFPAALRQCGEYFPQTFCVITQTCSAISGVQHIWLLDDKPVIEFWGFSSLPLHSDARMLDIILREEEERQQQLIQSAVQAKQSELSDEQAADEHPGEPDSEESPPLVVSLSQTCNVPDEEPVKTAEPETRKNAGSRLNMPC